MVNAIQVSESELESLRETCTVRKHVPFGLTIDECERGVYIVKGTFQELFKILRPTYPLRILVILGEKTK